MFSLLLDLISALSHPVVPWFTVSTQFLHILFIIVLTSLLGTRGMVASSQPLACEAGLEILRLGGNAADAAIAVSAVLGLTEPTSCGMGGDAFWSVPFISR